MPAARGYPPGQGTAHGRPRHTRGGCDAAAAAAATGRPPAPTAGAGRPPAAAAPHCAHPPRHGTGGAERPRGEGGGGGGGGRDRPRPPHTALTGVPSPRRARRCLSAAGGERRPPAPPSCPPLPTSRRYGTSKAGPAGPFAGKTAFVRDKLIKPKSPSPVEETGHREAAGRRTSRR